MQMDSNVLASIAFILSILYYIIIGYCLGMRDFPRQQGMAFIKHRSVGDTPFVPFILNYANTVLWLKYGMAIDDAPMCLVNVLGMLVSLFVTCSYYAFSPHRAMIENRACVVFAYLTAVLCLVRTGWLSIERLGFVATAGSLVMLGSPLSAAYRIFSQRDSSSLSPSMIGITLASSAAWCAYGVSRRDRYLIIPNLIGVLLAVSQLILWAAFKKGEKKGEYYETIGLQPLPSLLQQTMEGKDAPESFIYQPLGYE